MRLTTKGRFAVTAMVDLSMRQARGPVTLATISERQHISLSYLEQLFGKLRRAKLVNSVRGPGGGYNLAKPIAEADMSRLEAKLGEVSPPIELPGGGDVDACEGALTPAAERSLEQNDREIADGARGDDRPHARTERGSDHRDGDEERGLDDRSGPEDAPHPGCLRLVLGRLLVRGGVVC